GDVFGFYGGVHGAGLQAVGDDGGEGEHHLGAFGFLGRGGEGRLAGEGAAGLGPDGEVAQFDGVAGGGVGVGAAERGGAQVVEFLLVGLDAEAVEVAGVFVAGLADHLDAVGRGHDAVAVGAGGGVAGVDVVVGEQDVVLHGGGVGIEDEAGVIHAGEAEGGGVGHVEQRADGGEEVHVGDEVRADATGGEEVGVGPDEGDADGLLVAHEGLLAQAAVAHAHLAVVGGAHDEGVGAKGFAGGVGGEDVEQGLQVGVHQLHEVAVEVEVGAFLGIGGQGAETVEAEGELGVGGGFVVVEEVFADGGRQLDVAEQVGRGVAAVEVVAGVAEDVVRVDEGDDEAEGFAAGVVAFVFEVLDGLLDEAAVVVGGAAAEIFGLHVLAGVGRLPVVEAVAGNVVVLERAVGALDGFAEVP